MKPLAANRWLLMAIPALVVALVSPGCAPTRYVPPPLPPAAPAPPPQVGRPVFYVKVSHLNLRACPGMDCPKISLLERGEEVEKVGAAEDWFQIRVKRDGRLGWVDSHYLSPTPLAAPEAAPPPPPVEVLPPPPIEEVPPPPLPERPAPPPVEKAKPVKPEEAVPPAKQKPEEAQPAKPAKAKPEETGAPKEEKPPPQEEKPAPPPPAQTPAPGQNIRIM